MERFGSVVSSNDGCFLYSYCDDFFNSNIFFVKILSERKWKNYYLVSNIVGNNYLTLLLTIFESGNSAMIKNSNTDVIKLVCAFLLSSLYVVLILPRMTVWFFFYFSLPYYIFGGFWLSAFFRNRKSFLGWFCLLVLLWMSLRYYAALE